MLFLLQNFSITRVHPAQQGYPIRIDIEWWVFPFTGILVLVFALIVVGSQAWKAALANPATSLRDEWFGQWSLVTVWFVEIYTIDKWLIHSSILAILFFAAIPAIWMCQFFIKFDNWQLSFIINPWWNRNYFDSKDVLFIRNFRIRNPGKSHIKPRKSKPCFLLIVPPHPFKKHMFYHVI